MAFTSWFPDDTRKQRTEIRAQTIQIGIDEMFPALQPALTREHVFTREKLLPSAWRIRCLV